MAESASVPLEGHVDEAVTRTRAPARQWISWVALAMMTTSSVASLRAAPTMAVYGLACVFLYLLPAVVFLLPTSLVSAELASGWKGGIYNWVSEGISKPMGFLAVWCQFAMTIFYYPSLLGFVASTLAYVFNPALASSGVWTAAVIIVVYWSGVWVSSRGTKGVAGLASGGLIIGTLIPSVVLVVLAVVFLGQGNPSAAPMDSSHLLPAWAGVSSLVLIVNNFLSYSGMEMNAVHVSSLRKPATEFPKSMFLAMGLVLAIFILPALAISWVVPADELSLTAGVMQAFDAAFANFGAQWLTPIVGIMLVTASLGGMLTWLAGPSKGLMLISRQEGYLPPYLQRLNKNGVQRNILVVQGLVTTVIGLAYALIPDVSSAYWIFSVITTQVYLIMCTCSCSSPRRGCAASTPSTSAAIARRCSSACAGWASRARWRPCWSGSSRRRSSSPATRGSTSASSGAARSVSACSCRTSSTTSANRRGSSLSSRRSRREHRRGDPVPP